MSAVQRRMEAEMRQLGRKLDELSARARVAEARLRGKSLVLPLRRLKVKQAQAKLALDRLARRSATAVKRAAKRLSP